jgi:glutamate formiminotransferase/formiminotetrahydrofolate cyclodeaminase
LELAMTQGYEATSIGDLLDALASNDPVPGGGSAAALVGSVGVSLLLMVAGMSRTRTGAPEETADLAAAAARLRPLRDELMALIATDGDAYQQVLSAYKLPKGSDPEKAARRDAIADAMHNATEVPLQTMRACVRALREGVLVTTAGNPNAITDAAVGTQLLLAALRSAGMNVAVNLKGITDARYATATTAERQEMVEQAEQLVDQTARVVV